MRREQFTRTRTNQPSGFIRKDRSSQIRRIHTVRHDYIYYPNDWVTSTGESYQQGYYDENGVRYSNVAVKDQSMIFTCEYCKTQINAVWKEGEALTCPNCGAPLTIDVVDEPDESYSSEPSMNTQQMPSSSVGRRRGLRPLLLGFLIAFIAMISGLFGGLRQVRQTNDGYTSYNSDSIYVEEIGRTCYLDGEDYYDDQTQCWFYYNDAVGGWQYWYEGISSNYGDYGWMEYDEAERTWYIEAEQGEWIVLPQKLWKDYLWHIEE